MAVRMKDIARDLGVSVVTVSKVLRNHSDISAATRARVLKRMKELNYQPNLAARALVTGRTHSIGFVAPDLVHPFFAEVAKGLAHAVRSRGYGLLIASSEEDPELEQQALQQMVARRVDVLIVASVHGRPDGFRKLEEQKTAFILIDRQIPGLAANFVGVDDEAVGRIATEHLIEQGCRRIAHIRGPDISTATRRLQGYRQALTRHKMKSLIGYVVMSRSADAHAAAAGYEAMRELLALRPPPDGVFCFNDSIATGALRALGEAGLAVPSDVAVVGCGNNNYADLMKVPLSSVDQASDQIGERAAKLALSVIESKASAKPRTVVLQPSLVARASSLRNGG
jgi:LacI family transcriptional regulator